MAGWLCGFMTGLSSRGLGFKSHLSQTFFSLYESYFLLHYDILSPFYITPFSNFFMSSWQYLESKDIWGLRRVRELHIGKMRPFLFTISVAPTLQMFCMQFLQTFVCQPNSQTTLNNFNSLKPVIKKRQFNAVFTVLQNGFLHVFVCNF